jgi:hypothetical protein
MNAVDYVWSGAIERLREAPRSSRRPSAPVRRRQQSGGAVARFRCTRDRWSRERNVFGKAEYTPQDADPASSPRCAAPPPRSFYEDL